MIKNTLLILLILISCDVFSQRVVYSKSVILNIPPKKLKLESVESNKNEISTIENATVKFVDMIDSMIISDKNVEAEVNIEIDTVFENNEKIQVLKFSFQPVWQTVENISDYPSGTYVLESSSVSIYLANVVRETLQKKIISYVDSSDRLLIRIKGSADAAKIKGIKYKGEFGKKIEQNYYFEDKAIAFKVGENSIIKENSELAFLRTLGIRRFLEANITELQNFSVNFEHYVEVSKEVGGTYRRVSIDVEVKHPL